MTAWQTKPAPVRPMPGERYCPECNGEGRIGEDHWRLGPIEVECDDCEGTGIVDCDEDEAQFTETLGDPLRRTA